MKILTANELLKKMLSENEKTTLTTIAEVMIEFTKLHVKAALEEALENTPTGSSTDIPSYEEIKDAILNAYPLENIK